jgi:hypothetical protein
MTYLPSSFMQFMEVNGGTYGTKNNVKVLKMIFTKRYKNYL